MKANAYKAVCLLLILPFLLSAGGCEKAVQSQETSGKSSVEGAPRPTAARINPLTEDEMTEEQHTVLDPIYEDGRFIGVQGTFARHWTAFKALTNWGYHVMGPTSTLPSRDRELVLLRIGWLCQSEYEWSQHVVIGESVGITGEEAEKIKTGPDAEDWAPFDAALLRATDELYYQAMISDDTWNTLSENYSEQQMMDLVFAIGTYNMYSWAFNSFGVQLEEGSVGN